MHSEEAGNTLAGPGREHIISEDGRGWNKRWVWSSRVTYSVCVKLRGGASVVEMEWIWGVNAKRTEIDAEGASISTSTCCFNKTQGGNRALSRKKKKKKRLLCCGQYLFWLQQHWSLILWEVVRESIVNYSWSVFTLKSGCSSRRGDTLTLVLLRGMRGDDSSARGKHFSWTFHSTISQTKSFTFTPLHLFDNCT